MRFDEVLDGRFIEVTNGNHGHQVRPVPVFVKLLQRFGFEVLDNFRLADWDPVGIARALQQNRK